MSKTSKYIFVTGGVSSSLGKGIFAASIAKLIQARGYSVTIQKFDPYINIDPGTLNPYEHGECYVTEDGAETDLDLGHYERFLNIPTSQSNNVTTGKIYQTVINKERAGDYLGKTVQIIPHITDEIKRRMLLLGKTQQYDIIITELGGTVGDIESLPYIESLRQLVRQLGSDNALVCHLTLIPYLKAAKELKTKPTQHSVKELLKDGVHPNILVCRTEHPLTKDIKAKLAQFCNVDIDAVVEARDASSIYEVPLQMAKQCIDQIILKKLALPSQELKLDKWKTFVKKINTPITQVTVGLIGKYVELQDAYKSILESFIHAGAINQCLVHIKYIHSKDVNEQNVSTLLRGIDGVLVAPGFGSRAVQGKIDAIRYVRENQIPFLGICLGMQCAVIEFSRNVLGLKHANSTEIDTQTPNPVIHIMNEQKSITQMGGTMRLGAYKCMIKKSSKAFEIYGKEEIQERHRHRYEFNNDYLDSIERHGMVATGINPEKNLVEIVEIPQHPWFIAVQFHPELKSTVESPQPLFVSFIRATIKSKK